MPKCVTCGLVVDMIRTTYESRFYYSRSPDNFILGRYSYATDASEYLERPSYLGAGVWLDPWELTEGIGDSMEDYSEVPGEPLPATVFAKRRQVLPLREDCEPVAGALGMTSDVVNGVPVVCYSEPPVPTVRHTYAAFVDSLFITDGVDTYFIDVPGQTLKWSFSGYWYARDSSGIRLRLVPEPGYPTGSGMTLWVPFVDSAGRPQEVAWILPMGTQQVGWSLFGSPVMPIGYTFVSLIQTAGQFNPATANWPVNPSDIIP